jgi:hypothetical protein
MTDGHHIDAGGASIVGRVTVSATASVRPSMSFEHLRSAALFAGMCGQLESPHSWPPPDDIWNRHSAAASSAVVLAVCSLEAIINEFHLNAADGAGPQLGKAAAMARRIADVWDTVERQSLLRKFQWVLEIAGCEPFETDRLPYADVKCLVELRNELVHYKPEWSHSMERGSRLEQRLRGKFDLNVLAAPGMHFLPYRCLGAGCARWAVTTVLAFTKGFDTRLGVTFPFTAFEPQIEALVNGRAI